MASPAAAIPPRDLSLDLLRAGAILYIVGYYHIQEVWMIHLPGHLASWLARLALALFCFLSGFLLGQGKSITNLREAAAFLQRRLVRIYPLYLLFLTFFLALGLFPKPLFWPSVFLINTVLNWSLLTLWFVSMIFLFYLVTPFFLHRSSPLKTVLLGTGIFLFCGLIHALYGWIDPRVFSNFPPFVLGIYLTQSPRLRALLLSAPRPALASLAALLFLAWWTSFFEPKDAASSTIALVNLWLIAALPALFSGARLGCRHLPAGLVSFLASASFILYLSHRVVYHLGEKIHLFAGWERQFYHLFFLLPLAVLFSFYLQKGYNRLFG